jgi:hypothetical protein
VTGIAQSANSYAHCARDASFSRCCGNPRDEKKPHYTFTDTGQLDEAQRRRPEITDRMELLLKLVAAGSAAIEQEATGRARAVEETAAALGDVYETDELERLREDWPG